MGRPAVTFRQADIERAIRACKAQGLAVAGVTVTTDGEIRVLTGAPALAQPADELDQWRAKHGRRPAQGA